MSATGEQLSPPGLAHRSEEGAADWPPCAECDLAARGLLPAGWEAQIAALARPGPHRVTVEEAAREGEEPRFAVVQGGGVRAALPWLWDLYHGAMLDFASDWAGRQLYPANRLSSAITLNIVRGPGMGQEWHRDSNPVTGLLLVTDMSEAQGGALCFRDAAGRSHAIRPRPGLFVAFRGPIEHCVAPLETPGQRLSLPMNYYDSATDQPFASEGDRY